MQSLATIMDLISEEQDEFFNFAGIILLDSVLSSPYMAKNQKKMPYIKSYDRDIKSEHMTFIKQNFSSLLRKNEGLATYKTIQDFIEHFDMFNNEKYNSLFQKIRMQQTLEGKSAAIMLSNDREQLILNAGELAYISSMKADEKHNCSNYMEYNLILKGLSKII